MGFSNYTNVAYRVWRLCSCYVWSA